MDYKEKVELDWFAEPKEFKRQYLAALEQFKFNVWQSRNVAYSKFRNLAKMGSRLKINDRI